VKPHRCAALVAALGLAWSCGADLGPSAVKYPKGSVLLTDAPALDPSISSVIVYIDEIDASASSDSLTQVWTTLVAPHKRYDLITLQNGAMALLGTAELPPAEIREVRVRMNTDSSRVLRADGSEVAVRWGNPGFVTEHALVEAPLVVSDDHPSILLDFNVWQSFAPDTIGGRSGLLFIPWIRAVSQGG
jgi:hypothetical protein